MKYFWLALTIGLMLLLVGCAEQNPLRNDPDALAHGRVWGFWGGWLHGLIFPFAWIGSLFSSEIGVYAVYNTGSWYNFGYMLGLSSAFGSGSSVARR